ncbi:hypothetical protein F9H41_21515 [Salmonella enterica subsp. enterica serovar Montevideo]|uniref:Uncharacterized protein n=3 Tax=Salmonella enterica TaxID=28901 RepID=A0A5I3EM00_SALET|nr:hypothetical protein [Salmonella enterica subsp. enterica serovar Bredeney]EAA4402047.1 hypothetical protein [Salmonella enterica subsp. enterica serovar London]EAA7354189.1 hypothetical protein [Salmonella enterica subsp. enterica]EAB7892604.1 hypothetical protein [Salmonella enterica subsp. enterica serovar Newport]EAP2626203.1 hypothetical protein [Salmonella enterica]EBW5413708.1 hypothetical protein [Salmonella enterica subsp. enterica serovar Bonn]EBY7415659.1 hypothetical protein [S
MPERVVIGFPIGDIELPLCHGLLRSVREENDLILFTEKSSIYSTKPTGVIQLPNRYFLHST